LKYEYETRKETNFQGRVYSSFATSKGIPDRYETYRKKAENPRMK
jgi:hypothetical protein